MPNTRLVFNNQFKSVTRWTVDKNLTRACARRRLKNPLIVGFVIYFQPVAMNNKAIVIVFLGLLAVSQVYAHKCGTPAPPRGNGASKTQAETCFSSNPCDTASVR